MSAAPLTLAIPAEVVDAIAARVRTELLAELGRPTDPWLDVAEAADYLRCKRQRIYDLCQQGRLKPARDGSRLLLRRSWLDAYLESAS